MKFIPDPDTVFYVSVKPRHVEQFDEISGTAVVRTVEDGSYKEDIFRCIARDDTHIVAKCLTGGSWSKGPRLLNIDYYNFSPVGPGILEAMNLNCED